jgi:glycosyltransferase involved in cell wall biosynthesis
MNIAFYRHSTLTRGGDRMIIAYANFLAEQSHNVTLYTNVLDTKFLIFSKVLVKRIPARGRLGTIVWGLTHRMTADLVISDIIAMSVLLCVRQWRKVVYFAQDYDVFYYQSKVLRAVTQVLYFVGLRCLQLPCLAVSKDLKKDLERFSHAIGVVENGIDFHTFFREQDMALSEQKEGRKAIVVLGRKDYRKGLTTILKALDLFDKETFEFWVIGERIRSSLTRARMVNWGYVDQVTLRRILSSADAALVPSIHEGFGLFAVEALACGCPVVATKAVSFIQHRHTGWIFDRDHPQELQEGVFTLTRKGPLVDQIISNGYALAREYNIQQSCQDFEKHLLSIHKKTEGNPA